MEWKSMGISKRKCFIKSLILWDNELQAGAELCQAQGKLEVYFVEEGWSWRCNLGWG